METALLLICERTFYFWFILQLILAFVFYLFLLLCLSWFFTGFLFFVRIFRHFVVFLFEHVLFPVPALLTMDCGAGVGRGRGAFRDTPGTPVGRARSTPITSNLMPHLEDISNTDGAFAAPPQIGCVGHDLPAQL